MKRYKLAGAAILVAMAAAFPVASQQQNPLGDILIAHTSGFISIEYGKDGSREQSESFYFTLRKEIYTAGLECVSAQAQVDESRVNYLSRQVKDTIDSLKRPDGSYSDYLVVSGLLRKYAGRLTTASRPHFSSTYFDTDKWEDVPRNTMPDNHAYFAGQCASMVTEMLSKEDFSERMETVLANDICRSLTALKGCYADLDRLDAELEEGRKLDLRVVQKGQFSVQQAVEGKVY